MDRQKGIRKMKEIEVNYSQMTEYLKELKTKIINSKRYNLEITGQEYKDLFTYQQNHCTVRGYKTVHYEQVWTDDTTAPFYEVRNTCNKWLFVNEVGNLLSNESGKLKEIEGGGYGDRYRYCNGTVNGQRQFIDIGVFVALVYGTESKNATPNALQILREKGISCIGREVVLHHAHDGYSTDKTVKQNMKHNNNVGRLLLCTPNEHKVQHYSIEKQIPIKEQYEIFGVNTDDPHNGLFIVPGDNKKGGYTNIINFTDKDLQNIQKLVMFERDQLKKSCEIMAYDIKAGKIHEFLSREQVSAFIDSFDNATVDCLYNGLKLKKTKKVKDVAMKTKNEDILLYFFQNDDFFKIEKTIQEENKKK